MTKATSRSSVSSNVDEDDVSRDLPSGPSPQPRRDSQGEKIKNIYYFIVAEGMIEQI